MLFTEGIFFIFLTVLLFLYAVMPKQLRKGLLLIASYFFYGWWDYRFLLLLILATLFSYYIGGMLEKSAEQRRKRLLFLGVGVNLGILLFFKYYDFFLQSLFGDVSQIPASLNIILPVGMSFYIFQTISYILDVYRKQIKASTDLSEFALYISFFPQLLAGPIERAGHIIPQLKELKSFNIENWKAGFALLLNGYTRKVLIADMIAGMVDSVFTDYQSSNGFMIFSAILLFMFQLYFDFSGYSMIARGIARLFGIEISRNFNAPFLANRISGFWRNWHMTLSSWLNDYVFIPLVLNSRSIISGSSRFANSARVYLSVMITFLIAGLWHGATLNMVLWGVLTGSYMCIEDLVVKRLGLKPAKKLVWRLLESVVVFCLVSVLFLILRSPDIETTFGMIGGLFLSDWSTEGSMMVFLLPALFAVLLLLDIPGYLLKDELYILRLPSAVFWALALFLSAAIIATLIFLPESDRPFYYFQF